MNEGRAYLVIVVRHGMRGLLPEHASQSAPSHPSLLPPNLEAVFIFCLGVILVDIIDISVLTIILLFSINSFRDFVNNADRPGCNTLFIGLVLDLWQ